MMSGNVGWLLYTGEKGAETGWGASRQIRVRITLKGAMSKICCNNKLKRKTVCGYFVLCLYEKTSGQLLGYKVYKIPC